MACSFYAFHRKQKPKSAVYTVLRAHAMPDLRRTSQFQFLFTTFCSLVCSGASPVGLILTSIVAVVYKVAISFEG